MSDDDSVRPGIRVALFDLDDTLFAHRAAVDAAIIEHRRELPGWSPAEDAAEARRWTDLEEHHYHRYLAGELDFLGQRAARARDFAAPYGLCSTTPPRPRRGSRATSSATARPGVCTTTPSPACTS
ncbi:hypothetical protein BJ979_001297 [Schumannella luteola]|uniref:Uncharacterized protein n=1 Tax=Schumannella luteola TaxID=472059 RepID=A0A852YBW4_9MICO|nr:hypothetical protein [Schumannella luteola]